MYAYKLDFKVRDYECDLQGIVNNSVYQNYLEHTRHEFISEAGMDFAEMHRNGIDAVVSRIEIDYKIPLSSGDEFTCCLNVARQGKLRIVFEQDIYRKKDNALVLKAKVFAACISDGRPQPLEKVVGPLLAFLPD
jgi:acyl-CoA thioester hydrolase